MAKTMPNKPQTISDTQWLLTWQGSLRTDVITAVIGGDSMRISPFDRGSAISDFANPDSQSNGVLLDLGSAPEDVYCIDFTLDVLAEGPRSWTIEGLNTGEIWQNDAVKVPADAPCLVLTIEKAESGGWQIVAREKILGEQGDITVNEQIPESYRDLVAKSTARGLAGTSSNFSALVDVTASMRSSHDSGHVQKVLTCLVAISASANNRPLQVSYHGLHESRISVDEDLNASYSKAMQIADAKVVEAKPLHALVPLIIESTKEKSTVYVVTDSMFFVEDELVEDLSSKQIKLAVLLIGDETSRFALPSNENLAILNIGNISNLDVKTVFDKFAN